ncbi:hypothetical protein AMATHDRAFT_8483 [Amanita thiersii Skay4041]|uniref:Uncharacterized protein n=1 Tax=Amanita thiersii Skay4041 TaxID=703135 RepID=A0A2A9N6U7_9AGAR|nr:hypothetical protein AMATHDRAFT_8483 [Amanita thiersii Skay4041]
MTKTGSTSISRSSAHNPQACSTLGMGAGRDIGSVWYAPDQRSSVFTPKTNASESAAFVSAARYEPCWFYKCS